MRLPPDWTTEDASGYWTLSHLLHNPCGFRSALAYDLWADGPQGEAAARQLVNNHQCATND